MNWTSSLSRSINQVINRSVKPSVSQQINQSVDKSINQSSAPSSATFNSIQFKLIQFNSVQFEVHSTETEQCNVPKKIRHEEVNYMLHVSKDSRRYFISRIYLSPCLTNMINTLQACNVPPPHQASIVCHM